jgi:hypothetical protein
MNCEASMKELASKVFRQPPERLNCAQAVLHAWHEISSDTSISIASLKPFGGGHAPDGLCGALHAACLAAPERSEILKASFSDRLGSIYCKELHAGDHRCIACVVEAAELLDYETRQERSR